MKRLKERFGIQLREGRYAQLVNAITFRNDKVAGIDVEYIRDQSCRVREYKVKMEECPDFFIACYDSERKTVVTVLFPLPDGVIDIHRYHDHFGNVVNARTEYGKYLQIDINKGDLRIPATETTLKERTEETIVWESEDKRIWTWWVEHQKLSMELAW